GALGFIGVHAASGFVSGFATALVNGASIGTSLKAGMIGGVVSAGVATVTLYVTAAKNRMGGSDGETETPFDRISKQDDVQHIGKRTVYSEKLHEFGVSSVRTGDTKLGDAAAIIANGGNNLSQEALAIQKFLADHPLARSASFSGHSLGAWDLFTLL